MFHEMKEEILFLLLLVLGSFSGSECGKKSFDELTQELTITCIGECDSPSNDDECERTCAEHRHNVTTGVKAKKVAKIRVQCLDQEEGTLDGQAMAVRAEIVFQPSEDRCCRYLVKCRQNQGTYNRTIRVNIGKGQKTLNTIFTDLEFGASFTVIVEPQGSGIDGERAVMNFSTPSSWKAGGPPRICVPDGVESLDATVIHGVGNSSDLQVTWFRPVWLPDFFIAEISSRGAGTMYRVFHNVSGASTETIFRGMEISRQFDVSIRAWTILGGGPETSKRFTISRRTTDPTGQKLDTDNTGKLTTHD